MPEHTFHAEPGFLPGIKQFKATIVNPSYPTSPTWDIWAFSVDEAKDQAHEKAKKAGLKFDSILVTEVE
jgi:hypothetical protein